MTALNKQALRSREEFEEYYNETHAVKVTSQFKRFGYYVSPTMQKAWELWQKAQSSMRNELKSAENNLIDSECHVAELEESLRDKQALLEAAEKRIAELEARKVCAPRISNDEFWLSFNNRIVFREETYRSAVIKAIEDAGIGVKGE